MASVNKVILVGNVGKDPEVRYLEGGTAVANFPLATSETYKDKTGNRVETTEWHNVVAWRGLAEIIEKYVKKGSQLYIEGKLRTRSWNDKEGNKRYTTEIVADNLVLLGRKENATTNAAPSNEMNAHSTGSNIQPPPAGEMNPADDLPF